MQRQIPGRAVTGAMFGLGGLLLLSLVALGSATIASDVGNVAVVGYLAVALLHERLSALGWVGLGLPPGDGSVSSAEHGPGATRAGLA